MVRLPLDMCAESASHQAQGVLGERRLTPLPFGACCGYLHEYISGRYLSLWQCTFFLSVHLSRSGHRSSQWSSGWWQWSAFQTAPIMTEFRSPLLQHAVGRGVLPSVVTMSSLTSLGEHLNVKQQMTAREPIRIYFLGQCWLAIINYPKPEIPQTSNFSHSRSWIANTCNKRCANVSHSTLSKTYQSPLWYI